MNEMLKREPSGTPLSTLLGTLPRFKTSCIINPKSFICPCQAESEFKRLNSKNPFLKEIRFYTRGCFYDSKVNGFCIFIEYNIKKKGF